MSGEEGADDEAMPSIDETAPLDRAAEPAPIETPYALHVTPEPESLPAEPKPESPAGPAASPEPEDAKSGSRKRGWWQRVLS